MTRHLSRHPIFTTLLAALLATSADSRAAGFALIEQGASGLGNAYAGAAASAEDASTVFFNPAGLMYLQGNQLIIAGHIVIPSAEFSGSATTPLSTVIPGGDGGDAGGANLVPNLYYSRQLTKGFVFGLGINAPFGLKTEYDADWVGRFHAIESAVKTININPAIAYRAGANLSVGVGVNFQYIEATLSQAVNQQLACVSAGGGAACAAVSGDLGAEIEGDDWGYGYNIGLMYDIDPGTRLGFAYRSKIDQELVGDARFSGANPFFTTVVGVFVPTDASATITLPETVSLSLYHDVNSQWAILADATWTHWNRFQELRVDFSNPIQSDSVTIEDWTNSMRYALGLNYRHNSAWLLRTGVAFDEEPIRSAERRTPRIPGNDRTWLAIGANYRHSAKLSFDVGYARLLVDDTRLNHTDTNGFTITGEYDNSVNILSAQVNWTF